MSAEERIWDLAEELEAVCDSREQAERCAEYLVDNDYRKERFCEWVRDGTYEGKDKEIYVCSACNRYQTVKKSQKQSRLKYLRFCPVCGAMATNVVIQ